jgi:predicted amino acid dehydrogenase
MFDGICLLDRVLVVPDIVSTLTNFVSLVFNYNKDNNIEAIQFQYKYQTEQMAKTIKISMQNLKQN